ncbi:hypothetical protein N7456_006821 [Penicillium angulare]|uniref:AAA+ ATPase domain-containing protein n=1 Tax=Penicillium angulare TaxID=116970 RepID=A0A9W9KC16_9EURO|nr:hypothetical protein N7456_006821 [Penicillium angulare]
MFLECAVSALGDVNWLPESFNCLQIPPENKTLLLSMAKTRLGLIPTVPFDDLIDGKGQGLNILLDGPPGVGKTFTVEATSEYFKLPLYSISAGELVVDHGDSNAFEQQLETIFKIAHHFKAVFLSDEADAFMEQLQGSAKIEKHDLRRLGALHLNGREIQNIVAIAHALAEANASQVNYKYLELAAGSRQEFSKEFDRQEMYI